MSITVDSGAGDTTTITFTLPADAHIGAVSVVGSFNDWQAGVHELTPTGDGTRSTTVSVPRNATVHFRYLGDGGRWFDDYDADEVDSDGGVLRLADRADRADRADAGDGADLGDLGDLGDRAKTDKTDATASKPGDEATGDARKADKSAVVADYAAGNGKTQPTKAGKQ